jgi:hypothetical protein
MCVHVHAHTHTYYMYTYTYSIWHDYIYIYIYIYTCTRTHIHVHAHIHIHIHTQWNCTPYPGILIADGFLVPGKTEGGIYYVLDPGTKDERVEKLTSDKKQFFYHKVLTSACMHVHPYVRNPSVKSEEKLTFYHCVIAYGVYV